MYIHGYSQHSNKIWYICADICVVDNMVYIHGYSQHSNKIWYICADICVVDNMVYMRTVNGNMMLLLLICVVDNNNERVRKESLKALETLKLTLDVGLLLNYANIKGERVGNLKHELCFI